MSIETPLVLFRSWFDAARAGSPLRILGRAEQIPNAQADELFRSRSRDSQLASLASEQSAPLLDPAALDRRREALHQRFLKGPIPRPLTWGGYLVIPERIEFLSFNANRMHERLLFRSDGDAWTEERLQP